MNNQGCLYLLYGGDGGIYYMKDKFIEQKSLTK